MTSSFGSRLREKYRTTFCNRRFVWSFVFAIVFLIAALVINVFAGIYASERASNAVSDIILSNIPVFNVDDIFVWGPIIFWVIVSLFCLAHPQRLPFWLKSVALFVIIRSAFITLTHIGPFPDHITIDSFTLSSHLNFFIFSSGADLFFSGHTGIPYLMALIFWKDIHMRWFCLMASIFFGIVVLLGHLHYSIDVASAFFITYTIYHIALRFFPTDYQTFSRAE